MVRRVSTSVSPAQARAHLRTVLRSPLTLAVALLPPLVTLGDVHHNPASLQTIMIHVVLYGVGLGGFAVFMMTAGAVILSRALALRIPYTLVIAGCWVVGSLLYTIAHTFIFPSEGNFDHQIAHWLVELSVAAAALMVLVVHNKERILALGQAAEAEPAPAPAGPTEQPPVSPPPALIAPREGLSVGDAIISMQAQNQYVRIVRPSGVEMVRGSLAGLIARQPPGSGVQIHRSWWLGQSELVGAQMSGGDRLRGRSGGTYPVARNRTTALRDYLQTVAA